MTNQRLRPRLAAWAAAVALSTGTGPIRAADDTTAGEVRTQVSEALEAIQSYTADRRDDAVRNAKDAITDLDARIAEMESRADRQWNEMSDATREQTSEALKAMRQRRNALSEWYGAMKHGSAAAWEDVKRGFSNAFLEVDESLEEAGEEFE